MNPVTIITPCFNEGEAILEFLRRLEGVLADRGEAFEVVVIDDASNDDTLELLEAHRVAAPNVTLRLLSLAYNVGHQKAIYQGLMFAVESGAERIIVMDSDGEDDPAAIPQLLEHADADIVHAVRGHRQNSPLFLLLYFVYQLIFLLVTGRRMNFGNYSMISRKVAAKAVDTSFIHFAAHLSKQNVRTARITADRQKRIDGKSKMNTAALIQHAFRSFVEYADSFLMVFLNLFIMIAASFFVMIGYVFYEKLFTDRAILGWASTLSSIFFSTAIVCLGFFATGILLLNILSRQEAIPERKIYAEVTPGSQTSEGR